ncbi:MAG: hypothetical protein V1911_02835 [Candidatus Micrarchaeota archaeon]
MSRGFVFTLDAAVCLIMVIAVTLAASSTLSAPAEAAESRINSLMLFTGEQDIVEVCTIMNDLSDECFSFFDEETGLNYCLNEQCAPEDVIIRRDYVVFGIH